MMPTLLAFLQAVATTLSTREATVIVVSLVGLVIIAVVLLLTIIGAFVLKSMPGFTNESFLKLMAMVYRQVPLILGRKKSEYIRRSRAGHPPRYDEGGDGG